MCLLSLGMLVRGQVTGACAYCHWSAGEGPGDGSMCLLSLGMLVRGQAMGACAYCHWKCW
ncbi:hypothetical protein LEMLEM_LOCUS186 [Lemmus lemmus]